MKDKRFIISVFLIAVMIVSSVFMASCSGSDDEDYELDGTDNMIFTLALPSDSENDSEWEFGQDKELFECSDAFMSNGDENAETQSFELNPVKSGTTTVWFRNESTQTTYTYECEINEDFSNITITSSKGESAGAEVDAPEPVLERN